ncbi:MAG: alanine:cation symporter family protein [Gammaproteobacteria bacterium]|nr:alanine:cation symporter family protein [Gammaproteobacteria bacterium]MBU2678606.1 alanine:cation symporter family protein [Gammaproteobacteria bacterium]NNC57572.1 alanine:cation symporter family protein [Woeseiaceae bacterium]NNL52340.1 alanine:cation symporter family protein [Woeseiaceae bacterium]
MQEIVDWLNGIIWSNALIYLCLGTGLFFSVLTRFVQVRLFKEMIRLLFSSKESDRGISSFQALSVSLSGRVGTGNIAGVAAAIGFGGPGAVFWMWVVAFLGASTAYVESALGQIYKEEDEGQYRGGPAYYIEKAMGQKWYAWIFAITTIVATGLLLPGVQSNSIGNAAELAFGGETVISLFGDSVSATKMATAVIVVAILGFIIFGGVKRIAHFTQIVVPFMALGYILMALSIIAIHIGELPGIFALIVSDAFTPMAGVGAAIGWGVKRGVYSNEAGQGTGPHAAAASEVQHPAQQGLVQAFSVYVDTLFVCSATAFMILITQQYYVTGAEAVVSGGLLGTDIQANSPAFTQYALESVMGGFGKTFVAVALFFFAFTTLLAYYYIAETNVAYIRRSFRFPGELVILKVALMTSVFYGTVRSADLAWALGDVGVGIMAWLNIIGILILFLMGRPALRALQDYEEQRNAGVKTYTFEPRKLGIKNAGFWEKT